MNSSENNSEDSHSKSLPISMDRVESKEFNDLEYRNHSISSSNPLDDSNLRISHTGSIDYPYDSLGGEEKANLTNIFEYYKIESKNFQFQEIKEEEELVASQDLSHTELKVAQECQENDKKNTIPESPLKKIAFRDDQNFNGKPHDPKKDYYMVIEHLDEINQKTLPKISLHHRLSIKRKTTLQPDLFHINGWSDLQEKLKDEYNFMNIENEMKSKMIVEMKASLKNYYNSYIKLRECKEASSNSKKEEESKKILLSEEDENKIYCEAYTFVKGMLFNLVSNPILLAKIVKMNHDSYSGQVEKYDRLIDVFTESFFENITDDEPYEINQIKFLSELIKYEIEQLSDEESPPKHLFFSKSFGSKIINHYTRRQECEKYLKYVLENPLTAVLKINEELDIDQTNINNAVMRRKEKRKRMEALAGSRSSSVFQNGLNVKINKKNNPNFNSIAFPNDSSINFSSMNSSMFDLKRKNSTFYYVHMFKEFDPSKLESQSKNKFLLSNSLSKFLNFWNESKIPKFVSKNKEDEKFPKEKNPSHILSQSELFLKPSIAKDISKSQGNLNSHEADRILNSNVEKIKNLLFCFMDSIFSNLYNMPVGIRIICKMIKTLALKKSPNMEKWQVNSLIGNFLFDKWILPIFTRPIFSGLYHDLKNKNTKNLILLNKIITKIFKGQTYEKEDIYGVCFNPFIETIKASVEEYYEELTNISDFIVQKILEDRPNIFDKTTTPNIRSVSICVSLEDIQLICEMISKASPSLSKEEAKILNYITKINVYDKEKKLFSNQELETECMKIYQPEQIYTLFVEIIFPEKLSINYMDFIHKLINCKNLSEGEKLLNKIKHILKQILITIDRVNSLSTLNCRKNSTLAEILENYQEKVYLNDSINIKSKEKIPISLSSKFLLTSINKIDQKYQANNWELLQIEMMKEYHERFSEITEVVYLTKSQLLKASENIRRYNDLLIDAFESQKKLEKQKWLFQKFIEETEIKVCVTSPITRASVLLPYKSLSKDQGNEELSNKIIIVNQKDCLHERFSFMKDLTSNTGGPKIDKKKQDNTHNGAHCDNIKEFIESFGSLPEVREVVSEGEDIYGVQDAFSLYLDTLQGFLKKTQYFKNCTNEEIAFLLDSLEKFITRKFYNKVFPEQKTLKDAGLYTSFRVLDWISYDDLEILPRNRVDDMWEVAIQHLNNLDLAMTPIDKLKCFVDCFKTIVNVLALTNDKGESAGADDSLPLSIYVLLKAAPQRLYSNINFISIFRNSSQKLLAQDGYSFTQISIAIAFIESLSHEKLKMTEYDFDKKIYEKEMEYEIYFIKDRARLERSEIVITIQEEDKQETHENSLSKQLNMNLIDSQMFK